MALLLCLLVQAVCAQILTDARSLEREHSLQIPRSAKPLPAQVAAPSLAEDGMRVNVQRIAIDGASLIAAAEFQAQVLVGLSLILTELEHGVQRLIPYDRERGWQFAASVARPVGSNTSSARAWLNLNRIL